MTRIRKLEKLSKVMVADLLKSSIDEDEAAELGLYGVKDASLVHPSFEPCRALCFPYRDHQTGEWQTWEDEDGKTWPYVRVKYFPTPKQREKKSFKGEITGYDQAFKSPVHVYLPVLNDIDWSEIAETEEKRIIITEGEKKSACACLFGFDAIGMGGAWNFRGVDGNLCPQLKWAVGHRSHVYIILDNDAETNKDLDLARKQLVANLITELECTIYIIPMPPGEYGKKIGLDDYLTKLHATPDEDASKSLLKLFKGATPEPVEDVMVDVLNELCVYIESEDKILKRENNVRITKAAFIKGSKLSTLTVLTLNKSRKPSESSAAQMWLTHPDASRCDKVERDFRTVEPFVTKPDGVKIYNEYRGVSELKGTLFAVRPFLRLCKHIMSNAPEDERDDFLPFKFIVWILQNMGDIPEIALVITGDPGGGKSLICNFMAKIFGVYGRVLNNDDMESNFYGWVGQYKVLSFAELKPEIMKAHWEKIKGLITDEDQSRNEKFEVGSQVRSLAWLLFTANENDVVAFGLNDRRMKLIAAPGQHPDGRPFYAPLYAAMKDPDMVVLRKIAYVAKRFDLKGWEPSSLDIDTREKRDRERNALSQTQDLAYEIKKGKDDWLKRTAQKAALWVAALKEGNVYGNQLTKLVELEEVLTHLKLAPIISLKELYHLTYEHVSSKETGKNRALSMNEFATLLNNAGVKFLQRQNKERYFMEDGEEIRCVILEPWEDFDQPISNKLRRKIMKSCEFFDETKEAVLERKDKQRKKEREAEKAKKKARKKAKDAEEPEKARKKAEKAKPVPSGDEKKKPRKLSKEMLENLPDDIHAVHDDFDDSKPRRRKWAVTNPKDDEEPEEPTHKRKKWAATTPK